MSQPPLSPEDEAILRKVQDDPRYFIERVFSIVDQSGVEAPFLFNAAQAHYFEHRTGRDMIVKSRKEGFSSLILAITLHTMIVRPNAAAAIVSHTEDATEKLLNRAKFYLKTAKMPIRYKDTKGGIRLLDSNSEVYIGTAGSRSFGRGDDLLILHLSESAHYANDDMITGAQEALIKDAPTWMIEESTARGSGTPFHQRWLRAIEAQSSWKAHFYGWHWDKLNRREVPKPFVLTKDEERLRDTLHLDLEQLAWHRWKPTDMAQPELMPQENPSSWEEAFLASGSMVFDWMALKRCEDNRVKPKWKGNMVDAGTKLDILTDPKGPLEIYLTPSERTKYLMTVDTALGVVGGAYTVLDVWDIKTWEQVAQWRGHIDPTEAGDMAVRLGAFYGWAAIAAENNYPGNAFLARLVERGYPNIWDDPADSGDELGWKTTEKSKGQFESDGRAAVRDGSLKLNSMASLNEHRTYVLHENGRTGPQKGCWQDTVITACKAASILKTMHVEPELARVGFHEVLGFRKRPGRGGPSGGHYKPGVV